MATYYCDLGNATYADATGVNHTGDEYTGPAGFMAAIRGTGNATKLAAGDILHLVGTGDLQRLVTINCNGNDVSHWVNGDVVRNKDGAGDAWTGKVVEANDDPAGAMGDDDLILVWLDANKSQDNIIIADGIENTTQAESVDPIASADTYGIIFDNLNGIETNYLHITGVKADWSTGDGKDYQAILDARVDGGATAAVCMITNGGPNYVDMRNITFQNSAGDGFTTDGTTIQSWELHYCRALNNSVNGFDFNIDLTNGWVNSCISKDNSSSGFYNPTSNIKYTFCKADGNGSDGIVMNNTSLCYGCLSYDNSGNAYIIINDSNIIINSVADSSLGSGVLWDTSNNFQFVLGCRITNNANKGLDSTDNVGINFEDYNVFHNNATGDLNNFAIGGGSHSYGDDANHIGEPTDDGYTNHRLEFDYDNEGGGPFQEGEIITAVGGVSGEIITLVDSDPTGNIIYRTRGAGGIFVNDDAITGDISGATADVNEPGTGTSNWSTFDMNVEAGAEIRSTPIILNWDE